MSSTASAERPASPVTMTWLGQSGVVLDWETTRLLIDPFVTDYPGRGLPVPDPETLPLHDVTAVLVTHEHDDHFSVDSLRLIREFSPEAAIVVPEPLMDRATELLGGTIIGAVPERPITCADAEIIPTEAWHALNADDVLGDGSTVVASARFLGYVVRLGGEVFFHAGDTVRAPSHAGSLRDHQVDVAFLPINGRDAEREAQNIVGNLTAGEAVALALDGHVPVLVPIHWDMFPGNSGDPTEAREAATGTGVQILELERYRPTAV